jgi:hypothetical protein
LPVNFNVTVLRHGNDIVWAALVAIDLESSAREHVIDVHPQGSGRLDRTARERPLPFAAW